MTIPYHLSCCLVLCFRFSLDLCGSFRAVITDRCRRAHDFAELPTDCLPCVCSLQRRALARLRLAGWRAPPTSMLLSRSSPTSRRSRTGSGASRLGGVRPRKRRGCSGGCWTCDPSRRWRRGPGRGGCVPRRTSCCVRYEWMWWVGVGGRGRGGTVGWG